jgi:hypothetical protein
MSAAVSSFVSERLSSKVPATAYTSIIGIWLSPGFRTALWQASRPNCTTPR